MRATTETAAPGATHRRNLFHSNRAPKRRKPNEPHLSAVDRLGAPAPEYAAGDRVDREDAHACPPVD